MLKRLLSLVIAAGATPLNAQDSDWDYTASVFGWFTTLDTSVETRFGPVEASLNFSEVWDRLDLALFSSFEARNGRWIFLGDLIYADLGSEVYAPLGVLFSSGEVDTRLTLLSFYGAYRVIEQDSLNIDIGGGIRYNDANIDLTLLGNAAPTARASIADTWFDPLLVARARYSFSDDWFGVAVAEIGGFGIEDASNFTWQAYGGLGYRINQVWSVQAGYRALSIDRSFGGRDIDLDVSGPMIGVQASF